MMSSISALGLQAIKLISMMWLVVESDSQGPASGKYDGWTIGDYYGRFYLNLYGYILSGMYEAASLHFKHKVCVNDNGKWIWEVELTSVTRRLHKSISIFPFWTF